MNVSTATAQVRSAEAVRRPDPATAFKQMDTQGKGYLTQSEFSSAVVNISAEGSRLADAPDRPSAQDAFTAMDTDGDGKLTATEFAQAAPPQGQYPTSGAGGPPAGQGAGGPPPGAGGPPPGGGAGNQTSDDSSQTYAAADTNRDGTVSSQEQLAYDATLAQVNTGTSSSGQNTKVALQTYQALQSAQ